MCVNIQHHLPRKRGHRDKRIPKGSENCREGVQEGQDGHMHAGGGPRAKSGNVAIGEWHQWHCRQDALQDQVRIEGVCQDRLGGRRQAP